MPLDAILERRLLIISGKGGVGKTTVAAALGVLAANKGLRVLVAEVEGKGALPRILDIGELTQKPVEVRSGLYAMNISPEEALKDYFEVQLKMKRIARPLVSSQLVYYVTHAAPGLRDILMLGKVWHMAVREDDFDLIVLDTPAAGHAVSMLKSPEGFLHAVPVGPLVGQVKQVLAWLQDPDQVAIHLVTLPEEMPVTETIETTAMLEDRVGMNVSGVFVNMIYPAPAGDPETLQKIDSIATPANLTAAAKADGVTVRASVAEQLIAVSDFYLARHRLQQGHLRTLETALGHTARLTRLPLLFEGANGGGGLERLASLAEEGLSR